MGTTKQTIVDSKAFRNLGGVEGFHYLQMCEKFFVRLAQEIWVGIHEQIVIKTCCVAVGG